MDAPEPSRSYMKRDLEESLEPKADRIEDEDDWEGVDKRKHRSSKSKKHNSVDETEEWDSGGKRKSSGDRNDGKKKSGGSSRAGSGDEEDYDTRKELRVKLAKKNHDEKSERKSSSGYTDRELESSRKSGRDVVESKGYDHTDENERGSSRKASIKPSSHETPQSKARSKVDNPHERDLEKAQDRDFRYSERKESGREKGHGTREQERNPRRRWDEPDSVRKVDDSSYLDKGDSRSGKTSDHKHGSSRERTTDVRIESGESKSRPVDLNMDKNLRSSSREEKRADGERNKSRGRSEAREEDGRAVTITCEERSDGVRDDKQRRVREKLGGSGEDVEPVTNRMSSRVHEEKNEKHRQQHSSRDGAESRERSVNTDEDRHARLRDRSGRELRRTNRSRSPERSARRCQESDEFDRGFSESDNERSISHKGKEREKESYRDDRSKGRDRCWNDRNRDREGSRDNWKKGHQSRRDKETKDGDGDFDYDKEWDSQRRERERMDPDKLHGRHEYRKDRGRTEGAKTPSSFGATNDKSDTIEIRPKSLDYGREESGSTFAVRSTEMAVHQNFPMGTSDEEWGYLPEDRVRKADIYGPGDELQERYPEDDSDQTMGMSLDRNNFDMQGAKGRVPKGAMNSNRIGAGQTSSNGSQPPFGNNLGLGSSNRAVPQGSKGGSRLGRGGRGRLPGRDGQRAGIPLPMMGPPFGHLSLPAGPMQPIGPNMSPAPGPPIGPGVFIPSFAAPIVWPGARGVDMNMLGVPPGLSLPPPGPSGPRFVPNMGTGPNPAMYFNQPGPGRGISPNMSAPGFTSMGPAGRGMPHDKTPMGWGPPRINGPPGKAPSRGEQNDYSQNFVDTGMRPQNFIRELELTSVVEDYPKLRELIQKKDEIVAKSASPPMYYKCDLREHVLSPEFFSTKFDVILVDPPWEEYVHRAPGVADHMEYWTFEEIQNLKIEAIADTPSFIFLWVGDGMGLEQGRQCLKKWGFRRCEDICWVKTNKSSATPGLRHDSHTLFQHSKEHCLMGIKGTVRRSTDGHIIHANIDTDIVIAEEPPYGICEEFF
ncbi:N6-adenosine-methyltransferase non-catalytic subunit MTB isoform X2 [Magnolia sinica]|uniref:N6-adenosine-methyltransferase non-catalytic subunit MTB isoform X2 n=1 Tax=Magnolia sinica TaxID=86752 RepID=UPI0026598CDA|nr:N6-adenosine-methyltransferase non-catalytic subunit MTB isoform X2 [Magnolia sinica]